MTSRAAAGGTAEKRVPSIVRREKPANECVLDRPRSSISVSFDSDHDDINARPNHLCHGPHGWPESSMTGKSPSRGAFQRRPWTTNCHQSSAYSLHLWSCCPVWPRDADQMSNLGLCASRTLSSPIRCATKMYRYVAP